MITLYGPNGHPLNVRALTGETATRRAANGGVDLADMLSFLPDPDPVLRKRGDGLDVLEDLLADEEVMQAVQARKLKTLNKRDYAFRPGTLPGGEATPKAKTLCDDLARDLEAVDMDGLISGLLDAPYFGMTVVELHWESEDERLRLAGAVPKPARWFAFNDKNELVFRGENMATATALPAGKFVLARHFPTYDNPYGLRLLSRCLWPVAFKRGGIEFWARFCEKFGQPWILGTARKNAKQSEINAMAANLANMVQDAVAVVPNDAGVEAVQFGGKGDAHKSFVSYWNTAINKVIKGQTLTSEVDGKGSYAAAKVHADLMDDFADADARLVQTALNSMARIYGQLNAPGELPPGFAFAEPEDLDAQAQLDGRLHKLGVRFTREHFTRRYGLAEDEFLLAAEQTAETGTDAEENFAEGGDADHAQLTAHQEAIDKMVEGVLPDAAKVNEKFTQRLADAVAESSDPEDLERRLAGLLTEDFGEDEQAELAEAVMLNAAMYGRWAVEEEDDAR